MRYAVLFLVSTFVVIEVHGQIIIQESDFTGRFGETESWVSYDAESLTGLDAVAAAGGANQTWDFTMATYSTGFELSQSFIELPADVPGSDNPDFADADFVFVVENDTLMIYNFQRLDAGTLISLGSMLIGDADGDMVADTFAMTYDPPSIEAVFPIEYEDTWRDSTSSAIAGLPTATYLITETEVDGWGMLVTPDGSEPALRIKDTATTFAFGVPTPISTSVSFDFVTKGDLSASLTLDGSGNVVSASYAVRGEMMPTAVDPEDAGLPETYILSQNYPNPFNPDTYIEFSLPVATDVELTVYTLTGKAVATLVDGIRPAGTHGVTFDASSLASGIYLYRLRAGRHSTTRMMNLLK